jgi:hypothetical protein
MRLIRPMTEDAWRPVTREKPVIWAPTSINELIVQCCSHDPVNRPSFADILEELTSGKAKQEIDSNSYGRNVGSTLVATNVLLSDRDRKEALFTKQLSDLNSPPPRLLQQTKSSSSFQQQRGLMRTLKSIKEMALVALSVTTPRSTDSASSRDDTKTSSFRTRKQNESFSKYVNPSSAVKEEEGEGGEGDHKDKEVEFKQDDEDADDHRMSEKGRVSDEAVAVSSTKSLRNVSFREILSFDTVGSSFEAPQHNPGHNTDGDEFNDVVNINSGGGSGGGGGGSDNNGEETVTTRTFSSSPKMKAVAKPPTKRLSKSQQQESIKEKKEKKIDEVEFV